MAAVVGVCITSVCIICVRRECVLVRVCILYESCECYQGVCVYLRSVSVWGRIG